MLQPRYGGMTRYQGYVNSQHISGLANSSSFVSTDIRQAAKRSLSGSTTELEPVIKQEKLDSGYERAMLNQTGTLLGSIVPTTSANIPYPVTVLHTSEIPRLRNSQPNSIMGWPNQIGIARLQNPVNSGKNNGRNNKINNRPVVLLPHGTFASSHQGSVPAVLPRRPMAVPNAVHMSTHGLISVSAPMRSNAPLTVLISRPSTTAARIVRTIQTSAVMTSSSAVRHPVIRLLSASQANIVHLGSNPLARLKAIIGRSVLDKYVGPDEPPSELHMPVRSKRICQSCGDEFVTDVGLVDHISRRSMQMSFRCSCKLSKWPRLFYNPCMFESFYRSHCVRPGMHVSRDAVVITALDLGTQEYHSCLETRTQQTDNSAGGKEVGQSLENTDNHTVRTTADSNSNAQHVPSVAPVNEIYVSVEVRPNEQGNKQMVPSPNGTTTAVVKKTNKNHMVKQASTAKNGLLVKRGRKRSKSDSSLLTKVIDFSNALSLNRAKCRECLVDYKTRRWLSAHFSVNCGKQTLQCTDCGIWLPTTCSYNAHLRLHRNRPPFVCPQCGIVFDEAESVEVFKAHVERRCMHLMHLSSNLSTLNCPRCSFSMPEADEAKVAQHIVDSHAAVYYKCRSCPKAFGNDSAATKHSENTGHDAQKDILRKCPSCDAVFKDGTGAEIQSHVIVHLSSHNKLFQCPVCPVRGSHVIVVEHFRSCHPDILLPPTTCEVCGQPFASQEELFTHVSMKHVHYFKSVMKCLQTATEKSTSESRRQTEPVPNTSTVSTEELWTVSESEVQSSKLSTPISDTSTVNVTESASESDTQSSTEVFECVRCQMKFNSKDMYSRHQAKHRFLELKKTRKMYTNTKSMEDPLQQVFYLFSLFPEIM